MLGRTKTWIVETPLDGHRLRRVSPFACGGLTDNAQV